MGKGKILRDLIRTEQAVLAPGAYDALTALLIERAGFPAVYMSGFSVSATLTGAPDYGLVTQTEMIERARTIAGAVSIPLIADADTGYGNAINVRRTVREFERAGAAGIHLEDQEFPKRCGHMQGKSVISMEEHVEKIRAAAAARSDPDFVIVARTDAAHIYGLDEAIRRGWAYLEAGADMLFIEPTNSREDMEAIARAFKGIPLMTKIVEVPGFPAVTAPELARMGYRIILFPISVLLGTAHAAMAALEAIRRDGSTAGLAGRLMTYDELNDIVGLPDWEAWEHRFKHADPDPVQGR